MCDTCDYDYLKHSTFRQLNRFSVKYRSPFPFCVFLTVKSPSVTQRLISQENAYKKS